MNHTRRARTMALISCLFIMVVVGTAGVYRVPFAAAQTASVVRAGAAVDHVPHHMPQDTGVFLSREQRLLSASAQVDGQGNRHTAFTWAVPYDQHPPAVYASCLAAAACTDVANWHRVELADQVDEVQLQLTPTGRPRLLIKTASTQYANGKDYWYAACDADCTTRQAWSLTFVASSYGTAIFDIGANDLPQHSFALDRLGRPRFVYNDRNYVADPDHYGAYYVTCDAACTDSTNWHQTHISYETRTDDEFWDTPTLTFTSQNQPRVFARLYANNPDGSNAPDGFYYLGCDGACRDLDHWQRVYLGEVGGGSYPAPMWHLTLDGADRPHIVFFTGDGLTDRTTDNTLWYAACTADCFVSAQKWTRVDLGLDKRVGQSPALQLTARGQPRIAWVQDGKLGYSWCDDGCTGPTNWQHYYLETSDAWKQAFPQAVPPTCDGDVWTARAPVLALDPSDAAHIAFDIQIDARCTEQGPGTPTPEYRFNRIWDTVRWVVVPAGGPQPDVTPTAVSTTTAPTAGTTSTPRPPTTTTTAPTTVTTTTPTSQLGTPTTVANTNNRVYLPLIQQ